MRGARCVEQCPLAIGASRAAIRELASTSLLRLSGSAPCGGRHSFTLCAIAFLELAIDVSRDLVNPYKASPDAAVGVD